jgi:mannose-6-phosphate isomerase-like protein (cupin superfamily)
MIVEGKMQIALRDRTLNLQNEMVVIPKGLDHKPVCPEQYSVLLMEPKGTCKTAMPAFALTDNEVSWI